MKKRYKNKKAVSPVIATVLLIVVAIALFVIIFVWMKGFQKETIMKRGTAIENICPQVKFTAQKSGTQLQILNTGDIAIQSFKIVDGNGTAHDAPANSTEPLMAGETLTTSCSGNTKIIPILKGQSTSDKNTYACEAQAKVIVC